MTMVEAAKQMNFNPQIDSVTKLFEEGSISRVELENHIDRVILSEVKYSELNMGEGFRYRENIDECREHIKRLELEQRLQNFDIEYLLKMWKDELKHLKKQSINITGKSEFFEWLKTQNKEAIIFQLLKLKHTDHFWSRDHPEVYSHVEVLVNQYEDTVKLPNRS